MGRKSNAKTNKQSVTESWAVDREDPRLRKAKTQEVDRAGPRGTQFSQKGGQQNWARQSLHPWPVCLPAGDWICRVVGLALEVHDLGTPHYWQSSVTGRSSHPY